MTVTNEAVMQKSYLSNFGCKKQTIFAQTYHSKIGKVYTATDCIFEDMYNQQKLIVMTKENIVNSTDLNYKFDNYIVSSQSHHFNFVKALHDFNRVLWIVNVYSRKSTYFVHFYHIFFGFPQKLFFSVF